MTSDENYDASSKSKALPVVRSFASTNQGPKRKPRKRRRQEAKTKAFLIKTTDNTHVRLAKNLNFLRVICEKCNSAYHGDPHFNHPYLMEIKYEEGLDLTEVFLTLENAMKPATESTEIVMSETQKSIYLFHAMPKSWNNDLSLRKGQRKYIPYGDLKRSTEGNRYTLSKGTPEWSVIVNERALVASGSPTYTTVKCSYCDR
ncbi:Hypothetical protein PHPALM_15054 [Phytophthora palmivora]|uniref:Uncharacterized protein n=1 Tax=Phytophthora palmivora TaxID=4796 RepID=A0A2P4XT64_9STRA|nr:Hypothetical protein PHPALM_15054 [Phytophthora palmivora]